MKVEQWKPKDENWKRPDIVDNPEEWFRWRFGSAKIHEDITFTTNMGRPIILRWQKNEYRAFDRKTDEDLKLGAIRVDNLIAYIKERY